MQRLKRSYEGGSKMPWPQNLNKVGILRFNKATVIRATKTCKVFCNFVTKRVEK